MDRKIEKNWPFKLKKQDMDRKIEKKWPFKLRAY